MQVCEKFILGIEALAEKTEIHLILIGLTQAKFVIATGFPRYARNRLREGKQSQSFRRLRRYRS